MFDGKPATNNKLDKRKNLCKHVVLRTKSNPTQEMNDAKPNLQRKEENGKTHKCTTAESKTSKRNIIQQIYNNNYCNIFIM